MMKGLPGRIVGACLMLMLACQQSMAAEGTRSGPKQAKAMLERAVAYLQQRPREAAYAAFNDRKGPFVQGDLYVFVIDTKGNVRANGAAPEGLVGMNALDLRDASGRPFIQEMILATKNKPTGSVEYMWLNRATNHVETKTALLRRVGDVIVGVGYYVPRGTPEEAKGLLERAVAAMKEDPQKALAAFNDPAGRFRHYDLYVFAVGLDDARFYAMGANPALVGNEVRDLRDAAGNPIIRDMIALAKEKGSGVYDYVWRNPANNKVEPKHSYVERVDKYLVGVGYYTTK
jgi:cytochrome c